MACVCVWLSVSASVSVCVCLCLCECVYISYGASAPAASPREHLRTSGASGGADPTKFHQNPLESDLFLKMGSGGENMAQGGWKRGWDG